MRLQMSFDFVTEVPNVGKLAIVGTVEPNSVETQIFLICQLDPPPRKYGERFLTDFLFMPPGYGDLLDSVTSKAPIQGLHGQLFVFMSRTVKGQIRDIRKFLHATGRRLYRQLLEAEDVTLTSEEIDYNTCDVEQGEQTFPRHRWPRP